MTAKMSFLFVMYCVPTLTLFCKSFLARYHWKFGLARAWASGQLETCYVCNIRLHLGLQQTYLLPSLFSEIWMQLPPYICWIASCWLFFTLWPFFSAMVSNMCRICNLYFLWPVSRQLKSGVPAGPLGYGWNEDERPCKLFQCLWKDC